MLRTIAPDRIPAPADIERTQPSQDDGELAIDLDDIADIEATISISLAESQRLIDAAFPKPE